MKVNVGCGPSPTPGWLNIDNSPTVRLARFPLAASLIGRKSFAQAVRSNSIKFGTALRTRLPPSSVDVVYASHMLEHLDRREARLFLAEAHRILRPNGILRLVVPDLERIVERYVRDRDADRFVAALSIELDKPISIWAKLRHAFLTGFRQHHWMYDSRSLCRLLEKAGFANPRVMPPGETSIADPGALDLSERAEESIYVEAHVSRGAASKVQARQGAD